MASIIDEADLAEIRGELGPQAEEGQVFLVRVGESVRQGAGKTRPVEISFLLPGRVSYLPRASAKEDVSGGAIASHLRYLVELPAFTLVKETDKIDVAAPTWRPNAPIEQGAERMPSQPDGWVYAAQNSGVTGEVEPTWAPGVIGDGDVDWTRRRGYLRIEVVEVAQVDPYEVTRNCWGNLKG